jgi:hypothetical protein
MIIEFTNVEWNIAENEIGLFYKGNTQILIFEFEYLWSDSRKLGSDTSG